MKARVPLLLRAVARLGDSADVACYRDMVTIIRDRVQDLIKRGKTVDEIKGLKPTFDYDPRYATMAMTGDMFVEAVYRSLKEKTQ